MRIVIAGGGLQGAEAAYLAGKAGWESVVVDRRESPPAAGLADRFILADLSEPKAAAACFGLGDWVVPALENSNALAALTCEAGKNGVPLAFDAAAYAVTSSKNASNRLFSRLGLELPASWPEAGFPVIVKPDGASGSKGVGIAKTRAELEALLGGRAPDGDRVVQEFLPGPSYSIEVFGCQGAYRALQVTDLFMDAGFDCKRVLAPSELPPDRVADFENIAVRTAEALDLEGIMDVEVILSDGRLKLLEIDARLPSQTPAAVFWSKGLNMLEWLHGAFTGRRLPELPTAEPRAVVYEHVRVRSGILEVLGEHIVAEAGPIRERPGFFFADEALTDYRPGAAAFVATLIHAAGTMPEAWAKRNETFRKMKRDLRLDRVSDREPGGSEVS